MKAITAITVMLLAFATSAPAWGDIVRLSNGRIMTVDDCQFEGDAVILTMRGGGVVRASRDLVDEILPDEVPFARGQADEYLAESAAAASPRLAVSAIQAMVDRVAARVGLDGRLAHAVVRTESNYDDRAVSPKGAMGLMQIMPALARSYAVGDPFNPEQNLEAGLRHLRTLLLRFDIRLALAAYNAGEGAVARYGGVPPYRETQTYIRRVLAALR